MMVKLSRISWKHNKSPSLVFSFQNHFKLPSAIFMENVYLKLTSILNEQGHKDLVLVPNVVFWALDLDYNIVWRHLMVKNCGLGDILAPIGHTILISYFDKPPKIAISLHFRCYQWGVKMDSGKKWPTPNSWPPSRACNAQNKIWNAQLSVGAKDLVLIK